MSIVQMTRRVPARRVVGEEGEFSRVIDAEAVRAAAGHVVEADLARLLGDGDVEDVEAGPGVPLAGEPLRVDVEEVGVHGAKLVHVDAGRGAEFEDLLGRPGSRTSWTVKPSAPWNEEPPTAPT